MSSPGRVHIGYIIPRLLAVIAVLTFASGLLPLGWFRFQDYERARQQPQWDAPFKPNLQLETEYFEGDEAEAGNVPAAEHLARRRFTTDRLGFRFTPAVVPGRPPEVMVFRGFSFNFGVGLGDEETFPARLARELGVNAYNAARFHNDPEMPADYDLLTRKLAANPKVAVYVHLESNAHVPAWNRESMAGRAATAVLGPEVSWRVQRTIRFAKEFPLNWMRLSPLIMLSVEAKRALENDRVMSNAYRRNVREFPLPDGSRMLVRNGDLERAAEVIDEETLAGRAEYILWWSEQLRRRGVRMIAVLVPDKMSVYGPALGVAVPSDPYLVRLERYLASHGLAVVNGLPTLRAFAGEDLASGRLSYLREDEHWTALGVARLAEATARALKETAAPVFSAHPAEAHHPAGGGG
jgi:hypothetical protein